MSNVPENKSCQVDDKPYIPDFRQLKSFELLSGSFTYPYLNNKKMIKRYGIGRLIEIIPFENNGQYLLITRGGAGLYEFGLKYPIWDIDIPTTAGCISSDKKILALANNNELVLHYIREKLSIIRLPRTGDRILTVDFNYDNSQVCAAGLDGQIYIWNLKFGNQDFILQGHNEAVYQAKFSPNHDLLVTAGEDRVIRIWDSKRQVLIRSLLQVHNKPIFNLEISNDGTFMVSGSEGGDFCLWSLENGDLLEEFSYPDPEIHPLSICSIDLSANGRFLALSGGNSYEIKIFDLQTKTTLIELDEHTNSVESVKLHPTKPLLISGGLDNSIRIWDLRVGEETITLYPSSSSVDTFELIDDKQGIVYSNFDKYTRILDMDTGVIVDEINVEKMADGDLIDLERIPYTQKTVFSMNYGRICIWDPDRQGEERFITHWTGLVMITCKRLSIDGNNVIVAGWKTGALLDHFVLKIDVNSGKVKWSVPQDDFITSIAINPDNNMVAFSGNDPVIKITDMLTGELISSIPGHARTIGVVSFNKDGTLLASGSSDGTLRLWNTETWQQIDQVGPFSNSYRSISFNNKGNALAFGADDGYVGYWDFFKKEKKGFRGHTLSVNCVEFVENDTVLYSCSTDGTIRSWNLNL